MTQTLLMAIMTMILMICLIGKPSKLGVSHLYSHAKLGCLVQVVDWPAQQRMVELAARLATGRQAERRTNKQQRQKQKWHQNQAKKESSQSTKVQH